MANTNLSTRISISWPPSSPSEPTDTLVLSVNGWYVDLRVDKATGGLDWAIAGERLVDENDSSVVRFTHALDSHGAFSTADCGTFSTLPNGDDLEVGEMPRADVPGAPVCAYEEVWRTLVPPVGAEGEGHCVSWVLEGRKKIVGGELVRTFLGRAGGVYLALRQTQTVEGEGRHVQRGGEVSARREEWGVLSGWRDKYVFGPDGGSLPSMRDVGVEDQREWKQGQTVVVCGEEYVVHGLDVA
ncbi:hypothetical protein P168DRAFT_285653 [Aspergillus campestris IBT 28561]|uniref:Protein HRI1 n=1 Tax=Aspergillus campestris (strain IBT 28561) TaxID=1392248 RepID=A0A2I1CR94_ASPC2|nr:uncharacterized protein P168DRAFT_285653 [Aspergillus campestris IBT 28561]PKY00143.1 hypothetical protein P168DRAFT_285653 [Aspergillus campestris IBT 28561]